MAIANTQIQSKHPRGHWRGQAGFALGGRNSFLKAIQVNVTNFDTPSVATIAVEEDAITITGLTVRDLVVCAAQTHTANLLQGGSGRVSAADTYQLLSCNPTAAAIDAAAKDFFTTAFQVR